MGRTPHFSFVLPKEKRAVRGPKRKPLCRAPVQWPSARTGVSRIGAGETRQSSAGSRWTAPFPRPCAACPVGRKTEVENRMASAPEAAAALWPREGPFQRADTQVRPYGRTRDRHRLVGADLCVGPCPAREGQRQRLRSRSRLCRLTLDSRSRLRRATDVASPLRVKSAQRVSGASPGRRVPQGPGVSVPGCREGRPTFLRRRQEVRMYADRPAETFFLLTGCDRFLFDLSKRKWGHIGTSRHPG